MSEPVNLDALREVIRDVRGMAGPEPAAERAQPEKAKPGKVSGKRLRTSGFGLLSLDDQERFMGGLRAQDIEFGLVGKGVDREAVLPQSSLEGEPAEALLNLLASFGLAVG